MMANLETILKVIGRKWTFSIMLELYSNKDEWKRYTEIKNKMVEVTPKVFTARLRELEEIGFVKNRSSATQFPIKSEYTLTKQGKECVRMIKEMKQGIIYG